MEVVLFFLIFFILFNFYSATFFASLPPPHLVESETMLSPLPHLSTTPIHTAPISPLLRCSGENESVTQVEWTGTQCPSMTPVKNWRRCGPVTLTRIEAGFYDRWIWIIMNNSIFYKIRWTPKRKSQKVRIINVTFLQHLNASCSAVNWRHVQVVALNFS